MELNSCSSNGIAHKLVFKRPIQKKRKAVDTLESMSADRDILMKGNDGHDSSTPFKKRRRMEASTRAPGGFHFYSKHRHYTRLQSKINKNGMILRSMAEAENVVRIYMEPEFQFVRLEPRLPKEGSIFNLKDMKYIKVRINGVCIKMFVDSGTSGVVVHMATAKLLGFPLSRLKWKRVKIKTLYGEVESQAAIIRNQSIEFSDGLKVTVTISVFGKTGISLLGAVILKKCRCLQKFKKNGTCKLIFVPEEKKKQHFLTDWWREWYYNQKEEFSLKGFLDKNRHSGNHLKIKIDTGTNTTILSKVFMRKLWREPRYTNMKGKPKKVRLMDLGKSKIESDKVAVLDNPGDDLCIGTDVFVKYEALIDYRHNFLYLTVNGRVFRAKFHSCGNNIRQL